MDDEYKAREALRFDIQRSIRYHDRRSSFFRVLARVNSLVTILLAGIVLMDVLGPAAADSHSAAIQIASERVYAWWPKALAVVGALFSALDIVVEFGRSADTHRHLKRQFCLLEQDLDDRNSKEIRHRRLAIEAEEPPVYRALDALCYNEMCVAIGKGDQRRNLNRFIRLTAHLYRWPDIAERATQQK
jgi:hypothetical protein